MLRNFVREIGIINKQSAMYFQVRCARFSATTATTDTTDFSCPESIIATTTTAAASTTTTATISPLPPTQPSHCTHSCPMPRGCERPQAATDNTTLDGNVVFNGARSGINFNDCFGTGSRVTRNVLFNLNRETADHVSNPVNLNRFALARPVHSCAPLLLCNIFIFVYSCDHALLSRLPYATADADSLALFHSYHPTLTVCFTICNRVALTLGTGYRFRFPRTQRQETSCRETSR